jgi:hypothetical protein
MTKTAEYGPVDASPVKAFFVSMLTRDISLEEAILDLLDNCVDGILRSEGAGNAKNPYDGFHAHIKFDSNGFSITDNCGGIPWDVHQYAFRMGRADGRGLDTPGTVGVYGIGMKRAIFKMGRKCDISTRSIKDAYTVKITPEWLRDEKDWMIPVEPASKPLGHAGTTIAISNLYPGISERFGKEGKAFKAELDRMVASHYAFIIDKGFAVTINGDPVKPKPTKLIFTKKPDPDAPLIRPYIFKASENGVDVFLTVGFTRPIPSESEMADEQEEKKYSSLDAGWTVICNDRAVLYCDRTELTGWGEAGVPRYHNQFIAISGIVEFRSGDARKLPTTTTKRGIDASSALFLRIKNKMREGVSIFTNYTNKWKGRSEESKKHMEDGEALSLSEIKNRAKELKLNSTTSIIPKGEQYSPKLPIPKKLESKKRRISFVKDVSEVKAVSSYVFDDEGRDPSDVGEKCFELILKEARK